MKALVYNEQKDIGDEDFRDPAGPERPGGAHRLALTTVSRSLDIVSGAPEVSFCADESVAREIRLPSW